MQSCSVVAGLSVSSAAVNVVSVVNDRWCWKSKSIDVEVVDRDLISVDFTQTGFMLTASLSHSILLVCTLAVSEQAQSFSWPDIIEDI